MGKLVAILRGQAFGIAILACAAVSFADFVRVAKCPWAVAAVLHNSFGSASGYWLTRYPRTLPAPRRTRWGAVGVARMGA